MIEKRLVLAIILSVAILFAWSTLVSKRYPVDNKEVMQKTALPATPKPAEKIPVVPSAQEASPASLWRCTQDKYEIVFNEPQAAIKEVIFKDYQAHTFALKQGFLLAETNLVFHRDKTTPDSVSFVHQDENKRIAKHFRFDNSNYHIELELVIQNLSNTLLKINLPLILGVLDFSGDPTNTRLQDFTVAQQNKEASYPNPRKEAMFSDVKFLGLRERYFCLITEPSSRVYSAFIQKLGQREFALGVNPGEFIIEPGKQQSIKFRIYLGPQDLQLITVLNPEWSSVMYYGKFFNVIAHLLLQVLAWLYNLVRNWGLTIIILSVVIYIIFYPLTLKQMRSVKQMQALQPKIEELKKKYKDEPQKLNKEIMELYREQKVNPFGGCLPLVLQIPIFFALYQVLMRSVSLKGAKFLWIKDLASPDRLFTLPFSIPILGNEINLLPILMTIGMFIQQKTSMSASAGASAEQQRLMLILFPLMFGVIFYHMPSGLVLYWFTNSTLMLVYQLRINRQK